MNNQKIQEQWDELDRLAPLTLEERKRIDIEKKVIKTIVKARIDANATQQDISDRTNMKVPVISRFENGNTDPRLSTIIRYLSSIGKTINIVDISD